MFIADNSIYAFKKDIARLGQIDSTAQALSMATYAQTSNGYGVEKDYSLFGRKLEKQIRNLESLQKDVTAELKKLDSRIRYYEDKHNGMKAEIDLKNYKGSLIKTQIDIIKSIIDTEVKIEKGRIDIIKVSSDVVNQNTPGTGNKISTPDNFMASMFSPGSSVNNDPMGITPRNVMLAEPVPYIETIPQPQPIAPQPVVINQKEYL